MTLADRQGPRHAELIHAAQQGDQAAVLSLLHLCQPDIRRYARRSCKADDIDDAVQETLWILYRRVSGLRAAGALAAWLLQVVRRACHRLMRSPVATVQIDEVQHEPQLSVRSDAALRLDLAKAIGSLPPHYQIVVLMRDMQEMTIDEVAASLSLTREAVKARLHRARGLTREYLKD